jgi:glycerol-3-phosphate dehydrogenase
VTVAAAENAVQNGVTVLLETAFEDFIMEAAAARRISGVQTSRGDFGCRWAVNAAGSVRRRGDAPGRGAPGI